jgi:hypothetical protein
MEIDKNHEHRVRAKAKRNGFVVSKSRERTHVPNLNNHGLYRLSNDHNHAILGWAFDASLEQIEEYLDGLVEGAAA